MGLSMQPAIAPIIFGFYAKHGELINFAPAIKRKLAKLAGKLEAKEGFDPALTLYRGRVGWAGRPAVTARSVRKPVQTLILPTQP
jgi:hypothetical protein